MAQSTVNDPRIQELEKTLLEAQDAYYSGSPVMSDAEYDALADELRDLDPKNKVLTKIGALPKDNRLQKVNHLIPMGSQFKVNTEKEFLAWVGKTNSDKFVIQEKLDGASVELIYKNGSLLYALSRGNGKTGEDLTHNVCKMKNVFKTLKGFTGSLRGEILFEKSEFKKCNLTDYSNPRNAASGLSRRKDNPHKAIPHITVIYYDCDTYAVTFQKEHHKIRFMENELKLKCVPTKVVGVDNAIEWYKHYADELREQLDYEIDGLIAKVNDIETQNKLGMTDDRPKAQVAWKFAPEMRETILEGVEWEVGLTGRITPVALFKKVKVGGVEIKRASLHNVANMERLGVYKDAKVLISRRNDVIPYLEQVLTPAKGNQLGYPLHCPSCNDATEFDGEYLVCTNPDCPAKIYGNIAKWVKVLEIDQVGVSFLTAAIKAGFISDPADLYTLSETTISTMPGYGDSSAKTIVRNVNKTRELSLPKFLGALNIPNASLSTFTMLEKAGFNSLDNIQKADHTDFMIHGIGEITAKAIFTGLIRKSSLIEKLLKNGIVIKKKITGKLTGKSFCFTGEISIKRGHAMRLVEALGGEVKTSVSRGLDYLVQANANSVSGKSQKAKQYGTEVIGEPDFFKLVDFSFKKMKDIL